MNFIDWPEKIYQKIVVAKKILWFVANLFTMVPPFKQLQALFIKIRKRTQQLQKSIEKMATSDTPFSYLFQVYKQAFLILMLIIILTIYAYLKLFKNNKSKKKENTDKSKISRQLDELSEKTIVPKSRKQREQEKQQIDSCCEQLHNDLNNKVTHQDKVFLQILGRYQIMSFENQEEQEMNQQQISKNNKYTQDNSIDQGIVKNSLQKIPVSKKQTDLNRSSVL